MKLPFSILLVDKPPEDPSERRLLHQLVVGPLIRPSPESTSILGLSESGGQKGPGGSDGC